MTHPPFPSKAAAYDMARKEFYAVRRKQEVQRRVAREEALAVGAIFGPSALEFGMKLEDQAWDKFRKSASMHLDALEVQRSTQTQSLGIDLENEAKEGTPSEQKLLQNEQALAESEQEREPVPVGAERLGQASASNGGRTRAPV